ncbi:polyhydroxyalkanoic acid system family protein [Accumulibacter sp.]|uniref:polyhydroxyalkanoic acid system family protein n=1 Tax=Accumulibacter sp. TaxID=2053492 RepID=UPI0028C38F94|nr:polyhydroxyalkanoic acid system family protein [Accumulibacter sp.]
MSDIHIRRQHGKTPTEARASAEHMASELKDEFDLDYAWDGDVMRFERSGVSGELAVDKQEVTLDIHLGFLLFALKPSIEREVHKFFDENFPA